MIEPPAIRRLGDGYEPHVDEIDGRLVYSLPVDSGFMNFIRRFDIAAADLAVLCREPYRRAALYAVLHTLLQRAGSSADAFTQDDFRTAARRILFGSETDLTRYLAAIDAEQNIGLDRFIVDAMAQQTPAG